MHAGVLDVLADGPKDDLPSVRHRVDLHLPGVCLERRDHDRMLGRYLAGARQDARELVRLVRHAHRRAAQHVARADEHREPAEPLDDGVGVGNIGHVEPARLVDAELVQQGAELAAVLRAIDVLGARPEHLHARAMQLHREIVRDLAAHAHYHALGPLPLVEVEHRLEAHLVEDQPVAHVVVGADGLGVVVEHDGLVAERGGRLHGVDAAPVELDARADPVGARAEHHDLLPPRRRHVALAARGRSYRGSWCRPETRRRACRSGRCAVRSLRAIAHLAHRSAFGAFVSASMAWSEKPIPFASRSTCGG